jgi:hypothetical protein
MATGLATGVGAGAAEITATVGTVSGSATLIVVEPVTDAFVTTWNTSLGDGTTVTLGLAGTVDATIDWGDGTVEHVTTAGPHTHDYGEDGTYTVKVTGFVTAYDSFSNGGLISERQKLVSVDAWGRVGFRIFESRILTAPRISVSVPGDTDGIEGVTSMFAMFMHATSFNARHWSAGTSPTSPT